MSRVLIVVGSLGAGGIERLVASYSAYLSKYEYELFYVVFEGADDFFVKDVVKNGAHIIKVSRPDNRISLYNNIRSIIKKYGPFDVVHSHLLFSSGLVMKAAYDESVKIRISHSHDNLSYTKSTFLERIYHYLMRHYLNKYSTKFIACSYDAGVYLFGKNFIAMGGIVLKNRINVDRFKFSDSKRRKIRESLGVKKGQLLIGTIGRIEKQKNHKFIVDIMGTEMVKSMDMKAVIVGDGEEKDELALYIQNKKQDDRIMLPGKTKDVDGYLSAMDVFILPSVHEGLPLVLIEAQSNGLPCIVPEKIISDEAKVLSNFKYIPKKYCNDPDKWSKEIINAKRNKPSDSISALKDSGYDIEGLEADLLELYSYGVKR